MLRKTIILVVYLLQSLSTSYAEPIDLTQQADFTPHYRRRGLDNNYQPVDPTFFQPPSFTSEVEAAIRAHSAAYQATRARDLSQIGYNGPTLETYKNTERRPFQEFSSDPRTVQQNYFPSAHREVPKYYKSQNMISQSSPEFVVREQPTTTTPRPYNLPKDILEQQAYVLPPPKVQHYEKIWPLGKLRYRTLDVNVQTPYDMIQKTTVPVVPSYQTQKNYFSSNQGPSVSVQDMRMPKEYFNYDFNRNKLSKNSVAEMAIERAFKALQNRYDSQQRQLNQFL